MPYIVLLINISYAQYFLSIDTLVMALTANFEHHLLKRELYNPNAKHYINEVISILVHLYPKILLSFGQQAQCKEGNEKHQILERVAITFTKSLTHSFSAQRTRNTENAVVDFCSCCML